MERERTGMPQERPHRRSATPPPVGEARQPRSRLTCDASDASDGISRRGIRSSELSEEIKVKSEEMWRPAKRDKF